MMRGGRIILLLLAAAVAWVRAEDAPALRLSPRPVRDAVRATVEGQLAAIRAGKWDDAYQFAAAAIQRQFPPPVFAAMLRRGYPALVGHRRFEAGVVRDDRARRAEVVYVVFDARDGAKAFRFSLIAEDGRWRITGVVADSAEPDKPL